MIKNIGRLLLEKLDLKLLMKISGQRHIIPLYHTVSDSQLPHIENLYRVKDVAGFKKDVDFFLKYYKSVSVSNLLESLKANKKKEPKFHLTFDDGLKEIVTIIAPILLDKGIHATFFINPDFVNNKSLFYRFKVSLLINQIKSKVTSENAFKNLNTLLHELKGNNLIHKLLNVSYGNKDILEKAAEILEVDYQDFLKTKPFVDEQDIQWLLEKGFTIGAHSLDHPLYKDISFEDQIDQTERSLNVLEEKFKLATRLFAFPFTDTEVSKDFFNRINRKESTYSFGTSGLKYSLEKLNFQRVPMENSSLEIDELVKMYYLRHYINGF